MEDNNTNNPKAEDTEAVQDTESAEMPESTEANDAASATENESDTAVANKPRTSASSTPAKTETGERNLRKERVGEVTSNKMNKTITVVVQRRIKHPIYGKFLGKSSKFTAHDEKNECGIGDTVRIMETRPLSKNKRWRLVEILERAE